MWSPHIGHLVGRVTPCAPSFGLPVKQNVQFQRRAEDCPPYQHAKEGRIRDAGRQCLRSPVSPAPTPPPPRTLVPDPPSPVPFFPPFTPSSVFTRPSSR